MGIQLPTQGIKRKRRNKFILNCLYDCYCEKSALLVDFSFYIKLFI